MLKKTVIIAVAALLAAIALSAQPNKNASKEEAPTPDKNPPVILAAPEHQSGGEADQPKSSVDAPASHTALHDPNWVLVIVGVATCIVICWQSFETRRAANAARKTLISTLRPKIIVRKISIHRGTQVSTLGEPDADPWRIDFEFANVGQGTAFILEYAFAISMIESVPDEISYMEGHPNTFSLEPGEDRQLSIDIGDRLVNVLRMLGADGLRKGYQNSDKIFFLGNVKYADRMGIKRNLEALRHYDNASTIFKPVDDPDREYSD